MAELLDIDRVIHEEVHSLSAGSSAAMPKDYLRPGRLLDQYAQVESRNSTNPQNERESAPRTSGPESHQQFGYNHRLRASELSSRGNRGENSLMTFEEKESLKLEIRERAHKELEKIKLARSLVSQSSPNQDHIDSPLEPKATKPARKNSKQNKCSSPPLSKQPSQMTNSTRKLGGGYHSLAVSISSGGKSTPQKLGAGVLGSQSQLVKSQTIVSLEKELELHYRRKLAEAKHTITTTVREELAARFEEETQLLEAERAEVAQLKAELAAKTARVQQYKEEVTRDFDQREQQYLEIIEDLRMQIEALTKVQNSPRVPTVRQNERNHAAQLPFDGIDEKNTDVGLESTHRQVQALLQADLTLAESEGDRHVRHPAKRTEPQPLGRGCTDAHRESDHDPFEIPKTDALQRLGRRIIEERLKEAEETSNQRLLEQQTVVGVGQPSQTHKSSLVSQHDFGDEMVIVEQELPEAVPTLHTALQQSLRTQTIQTLGGLTEDLQVKLSDRGFRDRTFEKSDPGDLRPKTLLELILESFEWDDAKALHMKKLRKQQMRARMCEDVQLPRIEALLLVVQTNFSSLAEGIDGLRDMLSKLLEKLRSLWIYTNWSCDDRMTVLERLEVCVDPDEALRILQQEVNNLSSLKQNYGVLYDDLSKRAHVRRQLELVAMELQDEVSELLLFNRRTSTLYVQLRKINTRILGLLNKKGPRGSWITFPVLAEGSPLAELVALDYWEEEYLRRLEGRLRAGAV